MNAPGGNCRGCALPPGFASGARNPAGRLSPLVTHCGCPAVTAGHPSSVAMGSMVLSALSPVDAEAAILAHVPGLPAISLPLAALGGAILRETLVAAREQPPFDRVTMDGIALASSAGRERRSFRIAGTQAAGSAPLRLSDPRECIEVMTGAMLPGGCDCVIPVEKISLNAGIATLLDDIEPLPYL